MVGIGTALVSRTASGSTDPCFLFKSQTGWNDLYISSAIVSGRDSYSLFTSRGTFPVEDGIAKIGTATLRIGETQIQVTFPASTEPTGEGTREASNATCTFPFVWPVAR